MYMKGVFCKLDDFPRVGFGKHILTIYLYWSRLRVDAGPRLPTDCQAVGGWTRPALTCLTAIKGVLYVRGKCEFN